jgi:hypothetical protein
MITFFQPSFIINYQIKNFLKRKNFKNLNILDYGCGDQPYRDEFKNNNYYAYDINKKYKLQKKIYDVIFISFVLYQVDEPTKIIAKLRKLTKRSSIFIIIEPIIWFDDLNVRQERFTHVKFIDFAHKNKLKILSKQYFINNISGLILIMLHMMNGKIRKFSKIIRVIFLPFLFLIFNSCLILLSFKPKSFCDFSIFKIAILKKK